MVEKAGEEPGGTTISELGVPQERYVLELTGADGKLKIHAAEYDRFAASCRNNANCSGFCIILFPRSSNWYVSLSFSSEKPVINSQIETEIQH